MRNNWDKWFENSEETTAKGNLKRASFGEMVN